LKWGREAMPGEDKTPDEAPQSRPFITLSISKGSRLFDGRLPLERRKRSEGLEVDLDPVSFAALLASAGKLFTVEQVAEEIARIKQSEQPDDGGDGKVPGEGEA
jgi:hypothetical protein